MFTYRYTDALNVDTCRCWCILFQCPPQKPWPGIKIAVPGLDDVLQWVPGH